MDFEFTRQQAQFRQEVRQFFLDQAEDVRGAREEWDGGQGFGPRSWSIIGKIGARGWLCPTWPKKYGGLELSFIYRYIIMEQMHHFLNWFSTVGAGMAGPVILSRGSEAQKQDYLPRIARGEIEFALGYTEPNAGSDMASLVIHAEDKGDHFIISGSKLFNTRAHFAQYYWLGARTAETAPVHKGISLFIVDLKSPGINVNPIWTVGGRRTNAVYFDNVRVSRDALVGEKNRGFYYIMEAVDHERISTVGGLARDFDELLDYVRKQRLGQNPLTRQKLAELAIEIEAARLLALRAAWMLDRHQLPNYEAAMLKMVVSELEQQLVNTAMQVLGPGAQAKRGSRWAPLNGKFEWRYRDSLEELVTRGTSEIMRNIIAQRGLKLPRI
jgi:alkylation response protein AidB-like acyl-CoA dehydrogenase